MLEQEVSHHNDDSYTVIYEKIKRSFVSITREFTSHRKLILVHLAIVPEWKVSYEI